MASIPQEMIDMFLKSPKTKPCQARSSYLYEVIKTEGFDKAVNQAGSMLSLKDIKNSKKSVLADTIPMDTVLRPLHY